MKNHAATFSKSSVERALDLHVNGRWKCLPNGHYVVTTHGIGDIDLRSLREAFAFVCGCADTVRDMQKGAND